MTELRSCPFCGGEARIAELTYPMKHYTVICSNEKCYAQMGDFLSKGEAIEKWNSRWMIPCEEGETEGNWHTGTPTEEGDYLVAFHPWGRKEEGICYIGLKWEEDHWYDPVTDYFSKLYPVAWQKITPFVGSVQKETT